MTVRTLVDDFALANPYYAGASVHIFELDEDLLPTETLAQLYAGTTGGTLLENPQVLDSEGKFEQPVYVGAPVSTTVTRPDDEGEDVDLGVQGLVARWRGVWTTGTLYYPGERVRHPTSGSPYTVLVGHTSAAGIATDIAATRLQLETDVSALATSASVAAAVAAQADCFTIALSDEATAITTGDGKVYWHWPFAMTLTEVLAGLGAANSTSGAVTVDIEYWNGSAWASIFSTLLTIDANEDWSGTAATAAVLSFTAITKGMRGRANIDGAGTGAKGLKLYFNGTRA